GNSSCLTMQCISRAIPTSSYSDSCRKLTSLRRSSRNGIARRWSGSPPMSLPTEITRGNRAMAKTYRDVAMEQMILTVKEAMSRTIDWWGELPAPMNESIDRFRVQLAAAIDSVDFVKRALDRPAPETP